MNSYSLAAETHTWWLPSAIAGAIGAVAIGAVLVLPSLGHTGSTNPGPSLTNRTCFMEQNLRHGTDQLPQPVCK